jgi:hypothetical protein
LAIIMVGYASCHFTAAVPLHFVKTLKPPALQNRHDHALRTERSSTHPDTAAESNRITQGSVIFS